MIAIRALMIAGPCLQLMAAWICMTTTRAHSITSANNMLLAFAVGSLGSILVGLSVYLRNSSFHKPA